MVDLYGKWTAEENYDEFPKNSWCDCDYIAVWIKEQEYKPKTSIENLVEMIFAHYDSYLEDNDVMFYTNIVSSENGCMVSINDVSCFVYDSGGLSEFDYYC